MGYISSYCLLHQAFVAILVFQVQNSSYCSLNQAFYYHGSESRSLMGRAPENIVFALLAGERERERDRQTDRQT